MLLKYQFETLINEKCPSLSQIEEASVNIADQLTEHAKRYITIAHQRKEYYLDGQFATVFTGELIVLGKDQLENILTMLKIIKMKIHPDEQAIHSIIRDIQNEILNR